MAWWSNLRGTASRFFGIGASTLDADGLTAPRTHVLQDVSGTLAHLSDIPAVLAYLDPATTTTEALIEALIGAGWMDGPAPAVPVNTVAPAVTGGTTVGSVLSLSDGTWTGSPTSYAKQWQEDVGGVWTDLSGETGDTYTTDHAGDFRGEVVATNGVGDSLPTYSAAHTVTSGTARVFGNDAVPPVDGGFPGSPERCLASIFTKTHAGRITRIRARFRDTAAAGNARIFAFTVSAGEPATVLWASGITAIPAGGGTFDFDLPIAGIAGTDDAGEFGLGINVDDYDMDYAKSSDPGTGSSKMGNGLAFDPPGATWPGTDNNYTGAMCVWCDYIG